MNIVVDLLLVAIILISVILALKKGLIGTIFSLAAVFLSIVLSASLCVPVAEYVDSAIVNPMVKEYILGVIDNSSVGKSYNEAISSIDVSAEIQKMPDVLRKTVEAAGVDVDEVILKAENTSDSLAETKDELINTIAKPISISISRTVSLAALFAGLNIVLWIAAKSITALVNMSSFGKKANIIGGVIFGVLRGLAIVFVIAFLCSTVSGKIPEDSNNIFSVNNIESTVVLKTAVEFNPLKLVIK